MQFTLAVTALLAGVVISLSIPGLPQCAQDCVTNLGGCNKVDVKCICSNAPLLSHLSCCVSTACNATEQEQTINFADSICAGQHVTDLPTTATCSANGTSTSTATGSSSATSAAAASTSSGAASSEKVEKGLGMILAGLIAVL